MKIFMVVCAVLALTGCASTAEIQREMYSQRIAEQSKIDQSKAQVEAARYVYAGKLSDPSAQLAFAISDGIASALRASGAGQPQLPAMPMIEGWDDKLLRLAGLVIPTAGNIGIAVIQSNAQREASRNATALGIVQSNNALGATQSTNGAFAAFGSNMQGLGASGFSANATVANSGFDAARFIAGSGFSVARDLGMRPTTQITGSDNNIVTGTGNTTVSGRDNRVSSPGPCNPAATVTTPATATPTSTTGSPPATAAPAPVVTLTSDCAK